jgi:hypothetical protein
MKCPGVHCPGCGDNGLAGIAIGILVIAGMMDYEIHRHIKGIETTLYIILGIAGFMIASTVTVATIVIWRNWKKRSMAKAINQPELRLIRSRTLPPEVTATRKAYLGGVYENGEFYPIPRTFSAYPPELKAREDKSGK